MRMKNPSHPGSVVLSECIEPLDVHDHASGARPGCHTAALSELVNGKRGISPEMAIRLSPVFGGRAESWITQQGSTRSGADSPPGAFGSSGWQWPSSSRFFTGFYPPLQPTGSDMKS